MYTWYTSIVNIITVPYGYVKTFPAMVTVFDFNIKYKIIVGPYKKHYSHHQCMTKYGDEKLRGYIIIGHHVYQGNNFMMKSEDVHHCWKSFNTALWYSDRIA
jgi:hypothetical protein